MIKGFLNKKFFFVFLAVLVLAMVLAVISTKFNILQLFDTKSSNEFSGNFLDVKDNSITAKGTFVLNGDGVKTESEEPYEVEILVDSNTKIIRSAFYLPKTDKMFRVDELENDIKEVDFETLKEDFKNRKFTPSLTVKTNTNIYGKNKFKADEITYRLPLLK